MDRDLSAAEISEAETRQKANNDSEIEQPTEEDDDEEMRAEVDDDDEVAAAVSEKPIKRLTEGEIDVDVPDDEEDDDEDGEEDTDAEGDDDDIDGAAHDPNSGAQSMSPSEKAAETCRLPPKHISSEEFTVFPFLVDSTNRQLHKAFLITRNSACQVWVEDPTLQVTQDRLVAFLVTSLDKEAIRTMHEAGLSAPLPVPIANAAEQTEAAAFNPPADWNPWGHPIAKLNLERLAYLVVLFLERFGYINYGVFKVISPPLTRAVPLKSASFNAGVGTTAEKARRTVSTPVAVAAGRRSAVASPEKPALLSPEKKNPLKIIVIGAGAAGLMAARQLTYFGAKVTVLESRDRIGGRIWTCKRGDQIADFGAMIVTGMCCNPIAILCQQSSLQMQSVNTACTLYAPSGRPVSREKDEKMEEEFNRLLGTATHLCHTKGLETSALDGSPLSLGGVLEDLVRYQENHILPLKTTHNRLVSVLLERKAKTLNQMAVSREVIEKAYAKWQASVNASRQPVKGLKLEDEEEGNSSSAKVSPTGRKRAANNAGSKTDDSSFEADEQIASSKQAKKKRRVASKQVSSSPSGKVSGSPNKSNEAAEDVKQPSEGSGQGDVAKPAFHVIDTEMEYETRKLLSELHQAWKDFDPLQYALAKINRQLEVLAQNPPKDVYMTKSERHLLDWHFANLEFANATELKNLSLRHWDQDDAFELSGAHCTIKGGFGGLMEALVSPRSSGTPQLPMLAKLGQSGSTNERPALKTSDLATSLNLSGTGGCGQIELKSSVKAIKIVENGVTVESLNAAISQDDVISYQAAACLCTLPLGVLKESARQQREEKPPSAGSEKSPKILLASTAPLFEPPLPEWKLGAIERLGFGILNKVVLYFDRFFWDRNQRSFGYVSDSTENRGELFLFWHITDKPCLIALVAGKAAVQLEATNPPPLRRSALSKGSSSSLTSLVSSASAAKSSGDNDYLKEPIVDRAMQILRKIFQRDSQGMVPDPIDAYLTRWKADVHSRGSYSYVAVGATGEDYDLIAQPLSSTSIKQPAVEPGALARVFFAGEHTCRQYPASVHGAMISGLRESARIANSLFPGETPVTKSGFTFLNNHPSTTSD